MIKIENSEVMGWEHAIRGMRNPMNSWEKSDSDYRKYLMTINEYQKAAYRTANQSLTDSQQLQNGLMGLNGESGECIDILKKYLFQGHDLDKAHIAKELGDVAWYLAVSAQALGFDLETILQMNVEKLKARYPHGFNAGHSQHRSSGDI